MMRTLQIHILFYLIVFAFPYQLYAEDFKRVMILYINGIDTPVSIWNQTVDKLRSELIKNRPWNKAKVYFGGVYNPSLGKLSDLREAGMQKFFNTQTVTGRQVMRSLEVQIDAALGTNDKVVLIAHSQGNLFVHEYMSRNLDKVFQLDIIALGSPTFTIPGKVIYVMEEKDAVARIGLVTLKNLVQIKNKELQEKIAKNPNIGNYGSNLTFLGEAFDDYISFMAKGAYQIATSNDFLKYKITPLQYLSMLGQKKNLKTFISESARRDGMFGSHNVLSSYLEKDGGVDILLELLDETGAIPKSEVPLKMLAKDLSIKYQGYYRPLDEDHKILFDEREELRDRVIEVTGKVKLKSKDRYTNHHTLNIHGDELHNVDIIFSSNEQDHIIEKLNEGSSVTIRGLFMGVFAGVTFNHAYIVENN